MSYTYKNPSFENDPVDILSKMLRNFVGSNLFQRLQDNVLKITKQLINIYMWRHVCLKVRIKWNLQITSIMVDDTPLIMTINFGKINFKPSTENIIIIKSVYCWPSSPIVPYINLSITGEMQNCIYNHALVLKVQVIGYIS